MEIAAALEAPVTPDTKQAVAFFAALYGAQIAIDQAYLGLTSPAIFTALNKNTEELHHELVPFDQALAQSMSDRMVQIVEATKAQQLLPRAYNDPHNFKCSFCDFKKTCWNLAR